VKSPKPIRDWTIRQRIQASFLVIIAAMVVMGAFAYTQLDLVDGHAESMRDNTLPELSYSSELLASWNQNYSISQELAIQQDSSQFDELSAEIQANRAKISDLLMKAGALANSDETGRLDALKQLVGDYLAVQDKILKTGEDMKALPLGPASSLQRTALSSQAIALLRERLDPQYDKVRSALEQMVQVGDKTAADSAVQIADAVDVAKVGIVVSIAAAVALALISGLLLLRAVTRPLGWLVGIMDRIREGDFTQRVERTDEFRALGESFNRMADELAALFGRVRASGNQVDASVTQMAATAKEQQATAGEIAATTTQIGATSKQISATSRELVKTMTEVATVAEGTAALAGSGQAGLTRMEHTMHQVVQAAGSINAKLAVLNEKAGNINQVVTTITKVADQTNLLSLNAAIEAEKAGESGRGFAVVASEIRRLADQTAVATYDIEQMVKEIQSAVSAGVMGMDKFSEEVRRGMDDVRQVGTQLSQIIEQVQALVPRFEMANEGMQAQAIGAEQITEALVQLTEAAQQTVESLRQSTFAVDELNQVSTTLRSSVSRVKLAAA
jgi:methyl-accepting chemotaxis protein WspA